MGFIIGLLTFLMVLNCVVLTLLVLIQLPKKEAGVGLAFGSSASDALFGAGSGTVLTKITKYSATIFFILALVLTVLERVYHNQNSSEFIQNLAKPPKPLPGEVAPPPAKTAPAPAVAPAGTNFQLSPMAPATTNAANGRSSSSATNTPAAPAK
jgi:preprotein translocase subunit SecG